MNSRILEWYNRDKRSQILLSDLLNQINTIRSKSVLLAICPNNTGSSWLGIKNATISLFADNAVFMPQYYSHSLLTDKDLNILSSKLAALNFESIVFNGFPIYFKHIVTELKKQNSKTKIFLLFAGPASEFTDVKHQGQIELAVSLTKSGIIDKIGFNKKGLATAFCKIYGVRAGEYMVKTITDYSSLPKSKPTSSHLSIGVFGSDSFNKNLHTQVIAALLVENSKVHVVKKDDFSYLQSSRIVGQNGVLKHEQFLEKLRAMDVNSYLSFSESWGLVVTESLAQGTPCITSVNSGIFDYDTFLQEQLVVTDYDNVLAIKKQIKMVLENYDSISKKGIEYVAVLNKIADEKLKVFLEE